MSHRLESANTAGPLWGLLFGVFMAAIGMGLWFHAASTVEAGQQDESLAVAALVIGLFLAVYAGRELLQKRR
ncbi:hypothetical protein [Paraburkholderia sp. DHOC27]|uniref:hypothetical protein n=1 Tax=Paraburkholderia sp. DHOC27 TaxID=2303330 RepID=UPI00216B2E78|nr:hypothetical protein [Paraburkholderia sp. DHOC27]